MEETTWNMSHLYSRVGDWYHHLQGVGTATNCEPSSITYLSSVGIVPDWRILRDASAMPQVSPSALWRPTVRLLALHMETAVVQ